MRAVTATGAARAGQCAAKAALVAAMLVAAGEALSAADALKGFGSIPFGAKRDDAIKLNNGNGKLSKSGSGRATFSYTTLIDGLEFKVTHNFDDDDRAVDVRLVYNSRERPTACAGRFNAVLGHLSHRYGAPGNQPPAKREAKGGTTTELHAVQFGFRNRSAIKAELQATYPTPQASGQGSAPAPGAGAAGPGCQITLSYLPPGWVATF